MYSICQRAGLAEISRSVENNFNIKVYTHQMMDAIKNPLANLSLTREAYHYFTSMYNGQDFITSSGTQINFADIPKDTAAALHADVIKVLSDFNVVRVPTNYADTQSAVLLTSAGTPASLLDVIANPTMQFHINFQSSGDFINGGPDSSPAWSIANGTDMDEACSNANNWGSSSVYNARMEWGSWVHIHFDVNGLNATCHQPSCSNNVDWNISGDAQRWEDIGALIPTTANQAATNKDIQSLTDCLTNNM